MPGPVVAIIGRPNVGKSTLYNRIVGKAAAITLDQPGTTRDRIMAETSWRGVGFTIVDTGGLELKPESAIGRQVKAQIEAAIRQADFIIFLVDITAGVTPADLDIADVLRQGGKPVLVVANKADNRLLEDQASEFYRLGMGDPVAISAKHGRGIGEMLDGIVQLLPPVGDKKAVTEPIKVAIVGRPNVGKSMLLNALVGDERVIVDDSPGTTRDAVDTLIDFQGQNVLLIDTAGIRRSGRVKSGVEHYSVLRALRAIERADIALLVLDATEMVTAQDAHIAGYIQEAAKGIIIVVNKWDLVMDKDFAGWQNIIARELKFASYAPVLYTSAKLAQGIEKIMPAVVEVYQERNKRVPTEVVNDIVQQAVAAHARPREGKRLLKIYYATQAGVNPPTFVFFTNDAGLVHFSYRRYLENRLRQVFGFRGTPLRLVFRTRRGA